MGRWGPAQRRARPAATWTSRLAAAQVEVTPLVNCSTCPSTPNRTVGAYPCTWLRWVGQVGPGPTSSLRPQAFSRACCPVARTLPFLAGFSFFSALGLAAFFSTTCMPGGFPMPPRHTSANRVGPQAGSARRQVDSCAVHACSTAHTETYTHKRSAALKSGRELPGGGRGGLLRALLPQDLHMRRTFFGLASLASFLSVLAMALRRGGVWWGEDAGRRWRVGRGRWG